MPTKKQIAIINSRKSESKAFSEKEIQEAGIKAIDQIRKNQFAAMLNIQEVYGNYGSRYVSTSANTVEDYFTSYKNQA